MLLVDSVTFSHMHIENVLVFFHFILSIVIYMKLLSALKINKLITF